MLVGMVAQASRHRRTRNVGHSEAITAEVVTATLRAGRFLTDRAERHPCFIDLGSSAWRGGRASLSRKPELLAGRLVLSVTRSCRPRAAAVIVWATHVEGPARAPGDHVHLSRQRRTGSTVRPARPADTRARPRRPRRAAARACAAPHRPVPACPDRPQSELRAGVPAIADRRRSAGQALKGALPMWTSRKARGLGPVSTVDAASGAMSSRRALLRLHVRMTRTTR